MTLLKTLGSAAVCAVIAASSACAETPVLRAAVMESGTVNWELDTITHYGFDADHGFDLEVTGMGGGNASQIAFLGGEADVIVSDWLWVARQKAAGVDLVFIPYSKAVGGLLVKDDSPAQTLADLDGAKIGIAGGPLDKSWLILRAYAQQEFGMDLVAQTEQVFGAPPLIAETALSGETQGAINFWHWAAKMEAGGMHSLVDVSTAAEALGLDPETPLLGYVLHGETFAENPDLVYALADASADAKALLATDSAAWDRLRDRMNARSDEQFEALKAGFIAGIPATGSVDEAAAARMMALMIELGGAELVGDMTEMPSGIFLQPRN